MSRPQLARLTRKSVIGWNPAPGTDVGLGMPKSRAADAAFTAFVTEAQSQLARAALLLTGNATTADDLLQEALVRTYLLWHKVQPGRERAWYGG